MVVRNKEINFGVRRGRLKQVRPMFYFLVLALIFNFECISKLDDDEPLWEAFREPRSYIFAPPSP